MYDKIHYSKKKKKKKTMAGLQKKKEKEECRVLECFKPVGKKVSNLWLK